MPDITMCGNSKECSKRMTCYRHTARPDQMQSYAAFYKEGQEYCEHYYEVEQPMSLSEQCKRSAQMATKLSLRPYNSNLHLASSREVV